MKEMAEKVHKSVLAGQQYLEDRVRDQMVIICNVFTSLPSHIRLCLNYRSLQYQIEGLEKEFNEIQSNFRQLNLNGGRAGPSQLWLKLKSKSYPVTISSPFSQFYLLLNLLQFLPLSHHLPPSQSR